MARLALLSESGQERLFLDKKLRHPENAKVSRNRLNKWSKSFQGVEIRLVLFQGVK